MIDDSSVTHVTDTAFWVAHFRAKEARRPAPVFRDSLASLLCGNRGRQIARSIPRAAMVEWGTVVRTSAIDQLIDELLPSGVDTVLNLGAGLDTRPYRMNLPAELRWIEVDFPKLVDLKNAKLAEHKPVCRLERIGMDLLDRPSRNEIFARFGAASKNVLVITEGFISYFSNYEISNLAGDLRAIPSIRSWIQDFDNSPKRRLPSGWAKKLQAAPFLFEATDWFGFFEKYGWKALKTITTAEESRRIGRPYPWDLPYGLLLRALPKEMSQRILSLSGVVLMQRLPG